MTTVTEPQYDVAVVGDNTIDRYLDDPDLGDLVGGNALNVAVQLAMLGVRVRYFGAVGDDRDGEVVLNAMRRRALDTGGVRVMPGSTALTTIRRNDQGDRYFESEDFGVTAAYTPTPEEVRQISAASWVHIGMLPDAGVLRAALSALPANARPVVSQDCSVSDGLDGLTVAFASAGESDEAADELLARAMGAGALVAVATLGSRGAALRTSEGDHRVPSAPTQVVDTTGAGDSFMAGFIAASVAGATPREAVEAGTRRGAFTCRFVGGWPQLPADIETFG